MHAAVAPGKQRQQIASILSCQSNTEPEIYRLSHQITQDLAQVACIYGCLSGTTLLQKLRERAWCARDASDHLDATPKKVLECLPCLTIRYVRPLAR